MPSITLKPVVVTGIQASPTQFSAVFAPVEEVRVFNSSSTATAYIGYEHPAGTPPVAGKCIIPVYPGMRVLLSVSNMDQVYYTKSTTDELVLEPLSKDHKSSNLDLLQNNSVLTPQVVANTAARHGVNDPNTSHYLKSEVYNKTETYSKTEVYNKTETYTKAEVETTKLSMPYVAVDATYTILATDYTIDCTANTFTVTAPTAVGIAERMYQINNSGTGVITLDGNGSETFNGDLTILLAQWEAVTIQSTGANWIIL